MPENKKLANRREPTVLVPPIAEVVQIQIALAAVPVEVRHVAIVIPVPQERTIAQDIIRATAH